MRLYFIAAVGVLSMISAAQADCAIHSPSVMYLGDNGAYTLIVNAKRADACTINFTSENVGVAFKSLSLLAPPKTGALTKVHNFEFVFKPGAQGSSDQFKLKLCGKDTHGAGCNTLTYAVSITD